MYAVSPLTQTSNTNSTNYQLDKKLKKQYPELTPTARKRAVKNINNALEQYGNHKSSILKLSLPALAFLLAGSFGNGISQTVQEALMQLAPKAGVNGVIRKSGIVIADEAFVEIGEYAAIYFLPTILGISFALFSKRLFGKSLPHFELMGYKRHELEKLVDGEKHWIGTVNPVHTKVTKDTLSKVSFAKTMNMMSILLVTLLAEVIGTSARPILTKYIFGTDDFYKVAGLNKQGHKNTDSNDGSDAVKQAKKNILDSLKLIALIIPTFLLAQAGLARTKIARLPFFKHFSRYIDLDNNFGLSRTLVALTLIPGAAWGQNTTARNLSEAIENLFRCFFLSWPAILFFKQTMGTLLSAIVGQAYGVGNIIRNPFKTYWDETFGKNKGKRDLLDLSFVDIKKEGYFPPVAGDIKEMKALFTGKELEAKFSGSITNSDIYPKLNGLTAKEKQRFFQWVHFAKEHAPVYGLALPVGALIAWWNYQRTKRMHEADLKGQDATNSQHTGILGTMEGLAQNSAQYFYNIQKSNFNGNAPLTHGVRKKDLNSYNNTYTESFN